MPDGNHTLHHNGNAGRDDSQLESTLTFIRRRTFTISDLVKSRTYKERIAEETGLLSDNFALGPRIHVLALSGI